MGDTPHCTLTLCSCGRAATITYLGVESDIEDFSAMGSQGFWFPGIACPAYAFEKPTNFSEYNRLISRGPVL